MTQKGHQGTSEKQAWTRLKPESLTFLHSDHARICPHSTGNKQQSDFALGHFSQVAPVGLRQDGEPDVWPHSWGSLQADTNSCSK